MKTKAIAGIMLTLLLVNILSMAFIMAPTKAYKNLNEVPDVDKLAEPDPEDFCLYQGELSEENSTTRPTIENNWNFNKTNEWADFVKVDADSVEVVIGINDEKPNSYAEITSLLAEHGGELVNTVSMGGEVVAVVVDIPSEASSSFLEEVRAAGLSRYVEPNLKFQANLVPNDPYWSLQWGPAMIEADDAWDTTTGDPSVLVAVIDTGVDWNHPDLVANYVDLGYDWVNNDPDPMDDNGHGTHCAGIIAAVLNNGIGIAGLAQISVMAEKGLDSDGWGTEDDLANAIFHAVDQGADILSNSWGGYGESELIHEAVIYACEHDVLIVAAAGNEATSEKLYPAAYDEVIAVTATDSSDNPAHFTNFGEWVELAAPGVSIYSTVWNDGYTYMSGTSMATPHVAGVAALILSQFPNMTTDQVRMQLRFTADDLGDPGFDYYYGYGRVNARRAVEQAPPDHDLLILDWEWPQFAELGSLAIVNTTVFNFGTCNETDITVQLLVNGSVVDSATIDFLETATSETVSCSWTPTIEGTYNLTSYVVPVSGETLTANNIVTAMVLAAHFQYILFDQTHGTDSIIYYDVWVTDLTERGYVVDVHTSGPITPAVLVDYMAFVVPQAHDSYTPDELFAIQNFVIEGGGLLVIGDDVPSVYTDLTSFAGINWVSGGISGITTDITPHEVTKGVTSVYLDAPIAEMIVSGCAEDLVRDPMGGIMLAVSEQPGRVIGFADEGSLWHYYITLEDNLRLANNMIDWLVVRPEHDLAVTLEAPPYVEPGGSSLLNVTVRNRGLRNETNIELFLFINGTAVKNVTIPELLSQLSYRMDYLWTPSVEEALYNVTGYAVPVENETMTENNFAWSYVYVGHPVKAFVLDSAGTDFPGIVSTWQALSSNWYIFGDEMTFIDYSTLNKEDITYEDLAATDADVLIISCASDPWSGWEFTDSEIEAISRYVHEGHGLIATSGTFYEMVPNNNKLAPLFGLDETVTWQTFSTDLMHLEDPTHPLFANVPDPYTFPETATTIPYDRLWDSDELVGGEYVALGHFQESAIVVYRGLVYISPLLEYGIPPYYHFHLQLLYNAMTWSRYEKPEHELVVSLEAPTRLEPGESTLLNASVSNFGSNNETNVELFLLINGTTVENATIPELLTSSSHTLSYLWTPTVEAIYNVTAYAPPVPDEGFTENNVDTKMVFVREFAIENVLVYTDDAALTPSERYPIVALDNLGINYTHYPDDPYGFVTALTTQLWDLVIVSHNNWYAFGNNWEELEEYVLDGGLLVVSTFDIDGSHSEPTTLWSTVGVQWASDMLYPEPVYRWIPTHPIFTVPNTVGDLTSYIEGYYDDGDHVTATTGIQIAGFTASPTAGYAAMVVGNGGRTVLISFLVCEFPYDEDDDGKLDTVELWENAIAFVAIPVEHELAVTLDAPVYLRPGDSSLLNTTVCNRGINNETNVELQLLINGSVVDYVVIPELLTGSSYTLSYMWTPTVEATYNVTAYALPVAGEAFTANNIATEMVRVRSIVGHVVFEEAHLPVYTIGSNPAYATTGGYAEFAEYLTVNGYIVSTIDPGTTIDAGVLAPVDVLVIVVPMNIYSTSEIDAIETWVRGGGRLLLISDWGSFSVQASTIATRFSINLPGDMIHDTDEYVGGLTYWPYYDGANLLPHRITAGVIRVEMYAGDGIVSAPLDEIPLIVSDSDGTATWDDGSPALDVPVMSAIDGGTAGSGKLVLITDCNVWGPVHDVDGDGDNNFYDSDNEILALNSIEWLVGIAPSPHDVAIIGVTISATEVHAGQNVTITVVSSNQGNETETFNVTACFNSCIIGIKTVTGLSPGENLTLTFDWDTVHVTPGRNYTIRVIASVVPGETNTTNNVFVDGTVKIRLTGDINGDGKVDIVDLVLLTRAFGSHPRHPRWNPHSDINGDGKVDIVDLVLLIKNFGKTTPPVPPEGTLVSVINPHTGGSDFIFPPETPVGTTFVANIEVTDVTFLAGWQVNVTFDPTLLNVSDIFLPVDHIFVGLDPVTVAPWINDDIGYVVWACAVGPSAPVEYFNGSGIMCQIQFTIIKTPVQGETLSCDIVLDRQGDFKTVLADPDGEPMPFTEQNGYYEISWPSTASTSTEPDHTPTGTLHSHNKTPNVVELKGLQANIASDGTVKIKLMGDINGDGKVDIVDLVLSVKLFGSYPGHPRWNPEEDMNLDGKVDIIDVVLTVRNYGQCV